MRIVGIICEYNPLHGGHLRQIAFARQHADAVVCIQSGSFVQRGELAIADKFMRAKWALNAGADLVVELPCLSSLQSAQGFADGGVRIAKALQLTHLCFGSECDDLSALQRIAEATLYPSKRYRDAFTQSIGQGMSYAAARQRALCADLPDLPVQAFLPNATLGVCYLRAMALQQARLQPLVHARTPGISSTDIRQALQAGVDITQVPDDVRRDLHTYPPVFTQALEGALLYRLRTMDRAAYAALPELSEGIENRLYAAARTACTLKELLEAIKVKRYPAARIRRLLCCALLGITQRDVDAYVRRPLAYIRVLGMRKACGPLIRTLKSQCAVPLVQRAVEIQDEPAFQIERRATDLFALAAHRPCGLDFTHPLSIVD